MNKVISFGKQTRNAMKSLKGQIIIYDDACPMCTAYTGAFTRLGWLSHRIPFSQITPEVLQQIDADRGRHEIPLYNPQDGTTIYGLDALFYIIGTRLPFLKPLFRRPAFRSFWKQIYWVITYNRRIIAGSPAPAAGLDCAPDRHVGYRWLYIGLMSFFSLWLSIGVLASSAGAWLFALPAGLFLIAGLFLKPDRLSWLGHWITVYFLQMCCMSILPLSYFILAGMAIVWTFLFWKRWLVV